MNKLTKIGVSALCGSLASVAAAQAGEAALCSSRDGGGRSGRHLGNHPRGARQAALPGAVIAP
mgnify:CR=1 FL=1